MDVALKIIDVRSDIERARALREVRLAGTLSHPSIVPIRQVLEQDELVLVMDLLHGETLRQRLMRPPTMPWQQAAEIGAAIAMTVDHAHGHGVIHRDLKPENVFLQNADGGPVLRVLDFGIGKFVHDSGHRGDPLTAPGARLGTPQYMSPEQALAQPDVDQRADIWALGVMMYEMLTGGCPFEGNTPAEILKAIVTLAPVPLHVLAPDLPAALSGLVEGMLSREREQRPIMKTIIDVLRVHQRGA